MSVDLVRMPPELSRGFAARYDFGNEVVKYADNRGREVVRLLELPARSWVATKGLFSKTRIQEFVGFVRARVGAFHGFRKWDPTDFSTNPSNPTSTSWAPTDQFLGETDGTKTRFPIKRRYLSTPNDLLQRLALDDRMLPILNEVDDRLSRKLGFPAGTVLGSAVALDGTPVDATFDFVSREWVLGAPDTAGKQCTWGGLYDYPVSLDAETDRNLEVIAESWESQNVPSIGLELLTFDRFVPETDDPGAFGTLSWSSGVPLVSKAVRKHWAINPGAASLSLQIEDVSRHNAGGEHLCLYNIAAHAVTVVDTLTGSTMFTLGAQGSATAHARLFSRDNGSSIQWFWVLSG